MRVRHIRSLDLWLLSKGNKVLYRGKDNPWRSPAVMQYALRREGVTAIHSLEATLEDVFVQVTGRSLQ